MADSTLFERMETAGATAFDRVALNRLSAAANDIARVLEEESSPGAEKNVARDLDFVFRAILPLSIPALYVEPGWYKSTSDRIMAPVDRIATSSLATDEVRGTISNLPGNLETLSRKIGANPFLEPNLRGSSIGLARSSSTALARLARELAGRALKWGTAGSRGRTKNLSAKVRKQQGIVPAEESKDHAEYQAWFDALDVKVKRDLPRKHVFTALEPKAEALPALPPDIAPPRAEKGEEGEGDEKVPVRPNSGGTGPSQKELEATQRENEKKAKELEAQSGGDLFGGLAGLGFTMGSSVPLLGFGQARGSSAPRLRASDGLNGVPGARRFLAGLGGR